MRALWRNKWFILATVVVLFLVATSTRVIAAGADNELTQILEAGLDGLRAYFDWLLEVLQVIW